MAHTGDLQHIALLCLTSSPPASAPTSSSHHALEDRDSQLALAHCRAVVYSLLPSVLCRLVAVLERRVFVYHLETLQLLATLDTPPNPTGLAALTVGATLLGGGAGAGACLLAVPAGGVGALRVYDVGGESVATVCELQAHKTALVRACRVTLKVNAFVSTSSSSCCRCCCLRCGPTIPCCNVLCCAAPCCRRRWPGTRQARCWPPPPKRARWCVCTPLLLLW